LFLKAMADNEQKATQLVAEAEKKIEIVARLFWSTVWRVI